MADNKDEVRVEALIDHRGDPKKRKTLFFRVRWVGEEPSNDQWLPWKEVKDLILMDAYID
jgi:hypothetical protein